MASDIVHRASWGFFAIRQGEFTCCHGTPETGHHAECPYDKNLGPADFSKVSASGARGINFHDSTMALRHGPGSKYAENLKAQAETKRADSEVHMGHCITCARYRALLDGVCGECRSAGESKQGKPAKAPRKPQAVAGDLFETS